MMNRRRGRRKEGDTEEEYKNEINKSLAMKRQMGKSNGLNFMRLPISLSEINVRKRASCCGVDSVAPPVYGQTARCWERDATAKGAVNGTRGKEGS